MTTLVGTTCNLSIRAFLALHSSMLYGRRYCEASTGRPGSLTLSVYTDFVVRAATSPPCIPSCMARHPLDCPYDGLYRSKRPPPRCTQPLELSHGSRADRILARRGRVAFSGESNCVDLALSSPAPLLSACCSHCNHCRDLLHQLSQRRLHTIELDHFSYCDASEDATELSRPPSTRPR